MNIIHLLFILPVVSFIAFCVLVSAFNKSTPKLEEWEEAMTRD